MKVISPSYYNDFKCISSSCKHNCCIGWEIDIDDFSLARYETLSSEIGKKLKTSIEYSCDGTHFKLLQDNRCPFLNSDNLCEIITELGQDYLCDICTDHPRFRSFFSDRTEIGLGLCCEEAARIILTNEDNFFVTLEDDGKKEPTSQFEQELLATRDNVFSILADDSLIFEDAVKTITQKYKLADYKSLFNDYVAFLLTLEELDITWKPFLSKILNQNNLCSFENIYSKRLMHYFVFRHISSSEKSEDIPVRLLFSVLNTVLISALYLLHTRRNFDDIVEISRAFSSEIEYSDENLDKIFLFLKG